MKTVIAIIVIILGAAFFVHWQSPQWLNDFLPATDRQTETFGQMPELNKQSPWVAGFGKVEPVSQKRHLAFEISGLLEEVLVKEGDTVQQGQEVAKLRDDEYSARLDAARSDAQALKAQYDKLMAGARQEEKTETLSVVQRTKSVMENARVEMKRRKELLAQNLIAKEEVDRTETEYLVAEKEYEEARQRYLVMKNFSRKEDIATAWAQYEAAVQNALDMQAQLEKTRLRSPVAGKVLRVHRQPGENVSIFFECPVLTVADISRYQIRAEINEKYAALLEPGQKAYFTSEAFGSSRFEGRIERVGYMTGPKTVTLDLPQEKADTKVIETIISLDSQDGLVTGLTGDVFILTNENSGQIRTQVENTTDNQ
ncbi:HlyD family efflux transporter periplasmic adaptor subunit [uncultured Pseudodesulfovibrio sp.]|uniref:HlyD family secretion protein n=1 Tax=uncultured Pseudodesulfovibrio sp. TaxID=2035858 RepID=UPI0029C91D4A|nr:HlyD family efflux transporter periplasmic adaptor subunit [uncultured Pseudodesulfovibrio sp.]